MSDLVEIGPNEKRCSKCKEVKDRGEFYKNRNQLDGLGYWCKACRSDDAQARYKPKPKIVMMQGKRCGKCKIIKEFTEFYKNNHRKDGHCSLCKDCIKNNQQNRLEYKRISIDPITIKCPECHRYFRALGSHLIRTHKVRKEHLKVYSKVLVGKELNSKSFSNIRSEISKRSKLNLKKAGVIEIKNNGITIPEEYWVQSCRYAGVKVSRDKKAVYILPYLKRNKNTKTLQRRAGSRRYLLLMPEALTQSLDVERDIELLDRKGFAIKFSDKNDPVLHAFEIWAKGNGNSHNIATLSTYVNYLSLADHIWPGNMEFACFEWSKSYRAEYYLDIMPIFKAPDKSRKYLKLKRDSSRLRFSPGKFLRINNVPNGDWILQETLPSGALRFRLYKERNQFGEAS